MPSPTYATFAFTKTYSDLLVFNEAKADASFNSIQDQINKDGLNMQQLARDTWGVLDYQFNDDGVAQYANNLFDKQVSTKTYNGGDITLNTTTDSGYVSVDAVNAAISFTPEKVGKYRVTFVFTHTFTTAATTEGVLESTFLITDGTSNSASVRSGAYLPATAANSGKLSSPIMITHVFDWQTTNSRTITLQKFNRISTNTLTNIVAASAANGEISISVEKI